MKNKITYLTMSDGTKYPLIFTLNVMEEIQEKYGSLESRIVAMSFCEPRS